MLPVDEADSVRSRTFCSRELRSCSVESTVPSHADPSEALREYCSLVAICERSDSDETVPVGESDGRLIVLPLESCSCSFAPRARLACRLARLLAAMEPCVMRIPVTFRRSPRG